MFDDFGMHLLMVVHGENTQPPSFHSRFAGPPFKSSTKIPVAV